MDFTAVNGITIPQGNVRRIERNNQVYWRKFGNQVEQTFTSQATPSQDDKGLCKVDKIKGKTVAINQLVQNGDFSDGTNQWYGNNGSTFTVSNNVANITAGENFGGIQHNGINYYIGHKYYVTLEVYSNKIFNVAINNLNGINTSIGYSSANSWKRVSNIFADMITSTAIKRTSLFCMVSTSGDIIQMRNAMIVDLTPIENATGLTFTTVADFENYLKSLYSGAVPSYIPYTENTLVHFTGTGIQTTGANMGTETKVLPIATYFPDGIKSAGTAYDELIPAKATKRIGAVDLGTLNWTYDSNSLAFSSIAFPSTVSQNGVCNMYNVLLTYTSIANIKDKELEIVNRTIFLKNSTYTDANAFKTAMSGVMLYYELATPIETPINPPLNLNYKVEQGGTEQLLPINTGIPTTSPINELVRYSV